MGQKRSHDFLRRTRLITRNVIRVADVVVSRHLRRAPRTIPIILMFLTHRCNLACRMCGVRDLGEGPKAARELTTDEWLAMLRSAKKMGTTLVSISGGEPLLRPDVYDIARYAAERGLAVHICTNGTLLNEENVIRLRDARVRTVSISIESPDRQVHEFLRGPNTFARAVAGIRLLRGLAPSVRVSINCVITTANVEGLAEMVPFAESLGVHQIKFAPIHANLLHRRKDRNEFAGLFFTKEDLDVLKREVAALIAACRRSNLLTTSTDFLAGIVSYYQQPQRFRCYAGCVACAIDPTGMVAPCCDMDSTLSVREKPLDEIWCSKEFQALREQVRHCTSVCWDTTNTEFSLRLRPAALLRQSIQTWRDLGFYFDDEF